MASLFYDLVPKDPVENLRWRIACRERAIVDKRFRDILYQACMDDLCFWMSFACIGKGTRVVTDRGPIPIQDVTANDLVWDGAEWVSQGGAIYRGRKASIFAYKINVTPDHEIWTQHGWKPASERHDRQGVRIPDGYSEKWQLQKYNESSVAVPMQVRQGNDCSWRQSSRRQKHKLRMQVERSQVHSRNERQSSVQHLEWYASAMHKQAVQGVEALRWSWNQSLRTMAEVRELLRGHGRTARRPFIGSLSRQRWQLRAWQLSLGYVVGTNVESAPAHNGKARNAGRSNDHIRDHGAHWTDTCRSVVSDKDGIPERSVTSASTQNTKVYDLLNCGPRQCFTVLDADDRPLLVHNCWGYDPRARFKIVPFIPYPHQASVFIAMDEAINTAEREERSVDVVLDKARAQGGTFGYLWVDLRRWLRDPMFSAGFVTRNEDLIDSKSDSSTVLWKIAWAIERLPFWMKPNYERHLGHHTFINHDNGALLRGYSAGQDVAAGGRATVFTVDEAGARDFVAGGKDEAVQESIQDVSNCVRLVSARYVDQGVFHNACENPDTAKNGVHLILDWKDHPQQSKHSYIVREGVAVAIKPEDQAEVNEYHKQNSDLRARLERKGFKYEGIVRSPWYDSRCLRPTATPRLIASQLDRNPRGAVGKVFAADLLDRMKRENCRPAVWVGNPVFDAETCKLTGLVPRDDGALKLWFRPGIDNTTPLGPFTAGCDIASGGSGAYASNSVMTAIDDRTGEQVVEYTIKGLEPRPFARRVVGLCMWLRNAKLGWEDSGVSGGFAKEVMEVLYYGNVFFRNVTQLGSQKKSRKPGWPCRDADKADMFEQFALAMENKSFVPRSQDMITECGEYEWDGTKIIHAPTKNKGATDQNHADRAISAAGCWLVFGTDNGPEKIDTGEETGQTPEYGSFAWREQQERRSIRSGSPRYGIRDVITRG